MGNAMTVTAFCKLLMNYFTVRLPMTIMTGRQLAMGRVTLGAGQGRMFCLMLLQQLVCLVMTPCTDLFGLGNRIGDLKRGVHWMAGQAVGCFNCCHGTVIFMAISTLGYTPVFF